MLTASICTIGDEILIGQIVDTNKSYISSALNTAGIKVISHLTTGDDENSIESTINSALSSSDIVIATGGLGPTKDDITKRVLAKISGNSEMFYDSKQLEIIKSICLKREVLLSDLNKDQALVPVNCTVFQNSFGTAPAMKFIIGDKLLYSLPGVPYEMQHLMELVIKDIETLGRCEKIIHHSFNSYGIPESELAQKLSEWEDNLPKGFKLAYLPNPAKGVKLRLSFYDGEDLSNKETIKGLFNELKGILGNSLYGEGEDTLESVVSKALAERGETLSVAESCTGGNIGRIFTSIPGSSSLFKGGITAYDNSAKTDILGVDPGIIEKFGAVSEECVVAMAISVKKMFKTDWSISTSGIAGPDGGTDEKPLGTLWIAVSGPNVLVTKKSVYFGDRERNITRFSSGAVDFLRKTMGVELNFINV